MIMHFTLYIFISLMFLAAGILTLLHSKNNPKLKFISYPQSLLFGLLTLSFGLYAFEGLNEVVKIVEGNIDFVISIISCIYVIKLLRANLTK
jgi:type IV secretory pathway VirB2 component (pilin)